MARIAVFGQSLQNIYLIDHDDLSATAIGKEAILGKILVGSNVNIDKVIYEVGGNALSAAVSFARHGHETILLSNIARDAGGEAILSRLDAENIDSSYVEFIPRQTTGTSIILLDSKTNERTILTHLGASNDLSNIYPYNLDQIDPDWLYATTNNGDFKTLSDIFNEAKTLGTKIMFKPGAKEVENPKKLLEIINLVDVLIINKENAAKLVPGTILSELLSHLNNYVKTVIITDGQMGGIASNGEESYRFGIYADEKVKDLTGAGDAFGAGFLAHYAEEKSLRSSLIFASASSTSVITKIGTTNGILTGEESLHPMPIQKI